MTETNLVQSIRLALSRNGVRLFRNQVGRLEDKTGRWVSFGLAVGSADLVGWKTIVVTPDMIGSRLAIFTSVEVKSPNARTDRKRAEDQKNWRDAVNAAGGVGVQVTSVEEAAQALGLRSP